MGKIIGRIVVGLLLVALIAGGVWYFVGNPFAQTTSTTTQTQSLTQTVAVKQGDLRATVSVVGQLDAPQSQEMSFDRLSGAEYLLSLEVSAGNVVTEGQVLATLDPTPYKQALEQTDRDLQDAQAKLDDLQTPPTPLEFSQADLAIAQADLAVQKAKQTEDDLLNPDLATLQDNVSQAQLKLTEAKASLATAQTDNSNEDQLAKLRETGGDLGEEANRLSAENYSDALYQDRLRLANEAVTNNQDAIARIELQQQVNLLNAQINVRKAEQSLASAQEKLADAQKGADELDLAVAKQNIAQAQLDLAQARQDRTDLDAGPDETELASANATVAKMQRAIDDAQADLDAASLRAPFSGTVLQTNSSAGNLLSSATVILTLANLKQLQVVASIDETTIRQIQQGQPVKISFDAFAGQSFTGEVLSIPLQGTLQGDVMVYDVPMSLVGAEQLPLLVGMTANVEIQVGQVKNAMLLPKMAILSSNRGSRVLVPNTSDPTGEPQAVPVEIGLSDGIYTEIRSGLKVGDSVVIQVSSSDSSNFRFPGGGLFGGAVRIPGSNNRNNRTR